MLGILAWAAQLALFHLFGDGSSIAYGLSTAAIYPALVVINFLIQRRIIFGEAGCFIRFFMVNLSIMLLMVFLSPLMREVITQLAGVDWGDNLGFLVAALLLSPISFMAMRTWVFHSN